MECEFYNCANDGLGNTCEGGYSDSYLDFVLLDVVNVFGCDHEDSVLLPTVHVYLLHRVREQKLLYSYIQLVTYLHCQTK